MWWIGASGFATHSERDLARALLDIARQWHPRARVAIADSCVAARAATWASSALARGADARALICLVPSGGDAAYLASAPLALLPMDVEMRETLRALGVRSVGQLAALDPGDVEQRWGPDGLAAWRLAHGHDPRRPVLARLDDHAHVAMELAMPADTMEPVLFLVRPAVERLTSQLVSEGRAIASLAVTLTLDDARGALPNAQPHTVTREIRLPRPLARPAPVFERCRGLLSQWTLTAPVSAVRLTVMLAAPLTGEQGNLLDTSWRDPGAAEAALERVRAELGANVVVKPHARDSYTVERSGEWREDQFSAGSEAAVGARPARVARRQQSTDVVNRPAEGGAENRRREAPAENSLAPAENALRLLETPEQVAVEHDAEPRRVIWRGRAIAVAHAVGPERLSGDWWNDGYSRDYWRCDSDEHGELMLYRDAAGWWVQGWYD
jgi:protein ImuB